MTTTEETDYQTKVASCVAAEDIKPGDFIAVLSEIAEFPSFLWCCVTGNLPPEEPVRLRLRPGNSGQPHKVESVCLPFVYAKLPNGKVTILDSRKHQLVRLDAGSGRQAWKMLRKQSRSQRDRSAVDGIF